MRQTLLDAFEWSMRWIEYRAAQSACLLGVLACVAGMVVSFLIFWPLAIVTFIPLYFGIMICLNALFQFQERFQSRVVWPISRTAAPPFGRSQG